MAFTALRKKSEKSVRGVRRIYTFGFSGHLGHQISRSHANGVTVGIIRLLPLRTAGVGKRVSGVSEISPRIFRTREMPSEVSGASANPAWR